WQDAVERGEEAVMIIKTRAALAEPVRAAVRQLHSYTTPAILVLPIETVDPNYKDWLLTETQENRAGQSAERYALVKKSPRYRSRDIRAKHSSSSARSARQHDQYVRVPSITSLSATYSLHSVPQIRRTCSRSSLALSRLPCSACHMP